VSVVIPAHNRAEMLPRALASVRAQRPEGPTEVIVVDDHSSDRTAEIAEEHGARVVRHPENRGAAAARNTGVAAATQPWIALLDSDDEWLPHHLTTLWPRRQGHVLVGGAALTEGDGVRYCGVVAGGAVSLRSPAQVVYPENPLPVGGVLARRDAMLEAGGFDASLRYAEDFDLWIRMLERGRGLAVPTVVYRWNRHGGSKSGHRSGPRETHRLIVRRYEGRRWWTRGLMERRAAVAEWDDLRQALRERRLREAARSAAWIAARPSRLRGLAGLLAYRRGVRRVTARA
jgi:glycosyltransferase involved in cell wall biosynthesis